MRIFILENFNTRELEHSSEKFLITFDDLKQIYQKNHLKDKNVSAFDNFLWRIKYRIENWSGDFENYLNYISDIVDNKIKELNNITSFFYDKQKVISDILGQEEIDDDIFPFPLYVSANKNLYDDVGLMVFKDKIEYFEGNEDVTPETNEVVTELMGEGDKLVKIYGHHGKRVVDYIKTANKLPVNLYVSPDKQHALSHWNMEEDRYLISGYVKLNGLNRESEVDWKTNKELEITKLRIT